MRRQTYGYLPSRKASSPSGWYQIILLGDRGTRVLTRVALDSGEATTCSSQVQCVDLEKNLIAAEFGFCGACRRRRRNNPQRGEQGCVGGGVVGVWREQCAGAGCNRFRPKKKQLVAYTH